MTDAATTVDPPDPGQPAAVEGRSAEAFGLAPAARPYAPSWLDWLVAFLDRSPAPSLIVIGAIALVTLAAAYAIAPLSGQPAAFGLALGYYALLLPVILWLFAYLNGVARRALDDFRPLLPGADPDIEELRYRLTVVPAPGAWLLLLVSVPITVLAYLVFADAEGVVGLAPGVLAARLAYEIVTSAICYVTLYRTLRQLRLVHAIHAMAGGIDLYQPAPLYAFSSLTARAGMGLFLVLAPLAVLVPPNAGLPAYALAGTWLAMLAAISIAAFVVPLEGMHARISAQKRELEAAVGMRLTATLAAIHRAVDGDDLAAADGLNKNLASLIAERELVEKLPTWPWRPGTVGAFVTAMLLPIAIWLATRLLERVV